jgi:hypothetical protein
VGEVEEETMVRGEKRSGDAMTARAACNIVNGGLGSAPFLGL